MTTIGQFRREGDDFVGGLASLILDRPVRLVPTGRGQVGKAPDFLALAPSGECGAAWRAPETSGALLSLKLDDPAFAEPVHARLMAAEDGVYPLVWIRRSDPSSG